MILNIKDLKVENRVRKDFGDIDRLAEGIKKYGLLHPIVVRKNEDGYDLIAGERRVRAMLLLGNVEIEAKLFDDLNDLEAKEIELEENINRQNLTWPEENEAKRQLDEIKRELYGDAKPGQLGDANWGLQETAESLGQSIGAVSQDIKMAKFLNEHPNMLAKVGHLPKHAARKMIKIYEDSERLKKQVSERKIIVDVDLRFGDAAVLIDELKNESIDLWITDPPFALDNIVKTASFASYNVTDTNVGKESTMDKVYKKLIPAVYGKMKEGAHFYMFHGSGWYCRLVSMLRGAGFVVDDLPLIWYKQRASVMGKDMHYLSSYEPVLFGYKPPVKQILKKQIKNVFPISAIAPQQRVHPLQRPEELLSIFIENSSNVGHTVLDTFAGSGSTLVAARRLQRKAIGFELDETNYLKAQEWVEKEFSEDEV